MRVPEQVMPDLVNFAGQSIDDLLFRCLDVPSRMSRAEHIPSVGTRPYVWLSDLPDDLVSRGLAVVTELGLGNAVDGGPDMGAESVREVWAHVRREAAPTVS